MHSYKYFGEMVTQEFEKYKLDRDPKELYQPVEYILSIGGKRLRPVMTMMTCELFGGEIQKAVYPAMGMELFHNFTLIHDDIMDHAPTRRGMATVHAKWDQNTAILSGDAMLILANQLMLRAEDDVLREVMELYNRSGLLVCDGQQYDMNFESEESIRIEDYIKMIELKTAALLSGSARLGAVIAKTTEENKSLIEQFGFNLGISFQIEDDILDVYGNFDKFGKTIGGDILSNKKTYLLVKALEIAEGNLKSELNGWLIRKDFVPEDKIKNITRIFDILEIKKLATEASTFYYNKSVGYLTQIKVAEKDKLPLLELAKTLVSRQA